MFETCTKESKTKVSVPNKGPEANKDPADGVGGPGGSTYGLTEELTCVM